MKIKYNWIAIALAALVSLGIGTWHAVVNAQGGEFFLDKSAYPLVILGVTIFVLLFGAVLTVLDRETPKTYTIGKNFFAGFLGLLVSICYISDGLIGFTNLEGQANMPLFILTKLMELFAGGVFLAESVSSIIGKNLLKSKPLLTIAVPIMFALRLITLFFEYSKISVQTSEMFDIIAVALATLFTYYHAVMFAELKKSCVKSLFFFAAPMICVSLTSCTDIVVTAVIAGEFTISSMIMTVADTLLCLYTICLLAEITHNVGKQYLNNFADETDTITVKKNTDSTELSEEPEQLYSSFEEIESFGKTTPHIRRETILSEPAAKVEPKPEKPEVASHADALHEALTNNLAAEELAAAEQVAPERSSQPEVSITPEEVQPEPKPVHSEDATAFADTNPNVESEPIPEPTQPSSSVTNEIDMDRINRLLSEFEND